MHEQVIYYVALPVARRDDGRIIPDHNAAVECPSADFAVELARMMSVHPGSARLRFREPPFQSWASIPDPDTRPLRTRHGQTS
jgi:hypothetical protein